MAENKLVCKHCGKELSKVMMPDESKWEVDYLRVCMDDECPYYLRGWDHMKVNYEVKHSYRYFVNPYTGEDGPLPVSRPDDYKNLIVTKFVEKES